MESKEEEGTHEGPNTSVVLTNAIGLFTTEKYKTEHKLFDEEPRFLEQLLPIYATSHGMQKADAAFKFMVPSFVRPMNSDSRPTLRDFENHERDIMQMVTWFAHGPRHVVLHHAKKPSMAKQAVDIVLLALPNPDVANYRYGSSKNATAVPSKLIRLYEQVKVHCDMFWQSDPQDPTRRVIRPATFEYALKNVWSDVKYWVDRAYNNAITERSRIWIPEVMTHDQLNQWEAAPDEESKQRIEDKIRADWTARSQFLERVCLDSDAFHADLKKTEEGLLECAAAFRWKETDPMFAYLDAARGKVANINSDRFAQQELGLNDARAVTALFIYHLARRHFNKGWRERVFVVLDPYSFDPAIKWDNKDLQGLLYAPGDGLFESYKSYMPALFAAHRETLVKQAMSAFALTVPGYKDRLGDRVKSKHSKEKEGGAQDPFPEIPATMVPIIMSFLKGKFNAA